MALGDLHTHTSWSDGRLTMEEMVEEALKAGLESIGFSDHSFTPFDRRYCMAEEALPAYAAEAVRLREVYRGRIRVYAGLEWDGFSPPPPAGLLDYTIGDCHYIPAHGGYHSVDHAGPEQWAAIRDHFDGDALAYARAYFETYVERTRLHRPDILGHFDLCAKFGFMPEEDPAYRRLALDALLACLEVSSVVELNTGAIARGARALPYPAPFLWEQLREHGGKLILASDAHRGDTLAFGFHRVASELKQAGFDSLVELREGQFREYDIESACG